MIIYARAYIIMRASYDSIDNTQNLCGKVNFSTSLNITPLHSTELFKIFFSLLTLSTAFLQKASEPGKNDIIFTANCENNSKNCENNSKKGEVIRQKTQNNAFYLTGITPSRGN